MLELPELRRGVHLDRDEKLIFVDYQVLVIGWIAANDWRPQFSLNVRGDPNPQYWTLESEALTTETAQLPEQALLAAQVNNDQAARYRGRMIGPPCETGKQPLRDH